MQAKKVLVTGASGFIGAHCVLDLLAHDYQVRATVRTLQRAQELTTLLKQHAPNHTIDLAYADLMRDDGWHDAVQGC
ncbi:MAG: GDP-mannose 4,6-dehydratase, partial [Chloroflexota bacterium]